MSDAYHSCYVLSGLSSAQHQWELDDDDDNNQPGDPTADTESAWAVLPCLDGLQVFDNKDRVRPIHPVYAIPQQCVKAMRGYFGERQGF